MPTKPSAEATIHARTRADGWTLTDGAVLPTFALFAGLALLALL